MTDLSTKSPAELQALLSEREALVAEVQAALKARAEPDWDAWRPAVTEFFRSYYGHTDYSEAVHRDVATSLQAALPLAPAEPVDDAWIERAARECCDEAYLTHKAPPASETARQAARLAIRRTLAHRGARWPGEAELRAFRAWAASLTVTDMNEIVADNGITAGMVVSQEAAEQVRRLDRILGEPS